MGVVADKMKTAGRVGEEKGLSLKEQVEARKATEAEQRPTGTGNDGGEITPGFIQDCLHANKLGDGILYAATHKNRFIFNKSSQEWMTWAGQYWERDIMDDSLAAVETVSQAYLDEAARLVGEIGKATQAGKKERVFQLEKLQKKLYSRVWRLRESDGRKHCRDFGQTNPQNAIALSGEQFDTNPWLLGCKNGVVDLHTGKLRPGRQTDYISKACNAEWKGIDCPARGFDRFLLEVFEGNELVVQYINRLFGYGVTGAVVERVLPILWGEGWNGKGTLVEVIGEVLGPLAGPVPSEMLLDQGRMKGSTGPSPDIMALRGLRLAFASETDEGRRISPSRVKWLSGADTLTGRNLYDRYTIDFAPSHLLILLTNHKPQAPADDFAFWERVHLIPFNLSFVFRTPRTDNERPADKYLKEKLLTNPSGILAWLVRGCLQWQEMGLLPPETIFEATSSYRREEDLVQDFIDESCFLDQYAEIKAADLYSAFEEWWKQNISKNPMSNKKFGRAMKKRFNREKHGSYIYYGLGVNASQG